MFLYTFYEEKFQRKFLNDDFTSFVIKKEKKEILSVCVCVCF